MGFWASCFPISKHKRIETQICAMGADVRHIRPNIGFDVGFDVFTIGDFDEFMKRFVIPRAGNLTDGISDASLIASEAFSLVISNRVPWHLFQYAISEERV